MNLYEVAEKSTLTYSMTLVNNECRWMDENIVLFCMRIVNIFNKGLLLNLRQLCGTVVLIDSSSLITALRALAADVAGSEWEQSMFSWTLLTSGTANNVQCDFLHNEWLVGS